jgi:flagellar basal-body rod modification protein FlgD
MAIQAISGSSASTTEEVRRKDPSVLGKEDFLNILITQLKYQDPLDPLRPDDFLTQLAQLSSVESLKNMEEALAELADSIERQGLTHAVDLMGRRVEVTGNTLSEGDEVVVEPGGDYDRVILTLVDKTDGTKKEVTIEKGETLSFRLQEPREKLVYATAFKDGREVGCPMKVYRIVRGISMDGSNVKVVFSDGTTEDLENVRNIKG